ncbi:MAG: hypothetical protein SFX73_23625 [Kofleriaceae bacterium]|nr:hypothetical protein [Kofleriaceae bacterium]
MGDLTTMANTVDGRIARITLNRRERGKGLTLQIPRELAANVEAAPGDPVDAYQMMSRGVRGFVSLFHSSSTFKG